jgi:hypothetical protein
LLVDARSDDKKDQEHDHNVKKRHQVHAGFGVVARLIKQFLK